MNKDIQTLIEREAKEYMYSEKHLTGHYTDVQIEQFQNDSFIDGASFALSLFKWRKVSEELPEDNARVLVKSKGGRFYLSCYSKLDGFSSNANIFEWMPIPQID